MEEDFEEVPTGEGNVKLGNICKNLFYKTANVGYYELGERLIEPANVFDKNFSEFNNHLEDELLQ